MSGCYRWFIFDLDTNKMAEVLGSKTKGYAILRRWFKKNGCGHEQGSVYRSLKPIGREFLGDFTDSLGKENPWLATTVKKFAISSSGAKNYDFTESLRDAALSAEGVAGANDAESAAASAQKAAEDQKAVPADEFVKSVERENENVNE